MRNYFLILMFLSTGVFAQALPDGVTNKPETAKKNENKKESTTETPSQKYERTPVDLIIFPNAKQLYAGVLLTSESISYKTDANGSDYSETESENSNFLLRALYGLNNNIALGTTLGSVLKASTTVKLESGGKTEGDNTGTLDPVIHLIYRAMDVSRNVYDMNIGIDISPKIQDSVTADDDKDGNGAKGRDEYSIYVNWGRRNLKNSWAVGLQLNSLGKTTTKIASSKDKVEQDAYSTIGVAGDFQWKVSPKVSLELNLSYETLGEYTITYEDNSTEDYESAGLLGIGGTANFLIGQKSYIVVKLKGYSAGDRKVTDSSDNEFNNTEIAAGEFSLGVLSSF